MKNLKAKDLSRNLQEKHWQDMVYRTAEQQLEKSATLQATRDLAQLEIKPYEQNYNLLKAKQSKSAQRQQFLLTQANFNNEQSSRNKSLSNFSRAMEIREQE